MPGAEDKGIGGCEEGGKEDVKEVAGVEKRKGGGMLKTLAVPHCQKHRCVRGALLHLFHILIIHCVCVYMCKGARHVCVIFA